MSTKEIKSISSDEWADHRVGDLVQACSDQNRIDADAEADQALSAMRKNRSSRLMVTRDNKLVGLLTLKDLLEYLDLKVDLEVDTGRE